MCWSLPEPICQASLLSYYLPRKGEAKLLFSNPADESSRKNMTLRVSMDGGKTWTKSKILNNGPSAYSDLTRLKSGDIGCFYEAGTKSPYEGIVFQRVKLKEIR